MFILRTMLVKVPWTRHNMNIDRTAIGSTVLKSCRNPALSIWSHSGSQNLQPFPVLAGWSPGLGRKRLRSDVSLEDLPRELRVHCFAHNTSKHNDVDCMQLLLMLLLHFCCEPAQSSPQIGVRASDASVICFGDGQLFYSRQVIAAAALQLGRFRGFCLAALVCDVVALHVLRVACATSVQLSRASSMSY